ncbi:MAG: hypothetical protein Q9187_004650 [Circinaria calcarea]
MTTPISNQFPSHTNPRAWFITAGASPIGLALARAVLAHGDSVILGFESSDVDNGFRNLGERAEEFGSRNIGQCQAAVAEAVQFMGKIDILFCCTSEAIIGTVEELAASPQTLTLVRSQFETNFFGPVNIIKATLPAMRHKRSGHIIVLTGISSSHPFLSHPIIHRY